MEYQLSLFIAFHFFIATTLSNAMENKLPISHAKIFAMLPSKRPHSVICFPNNTVAIAGDEGCSLYDLSTNKECMKIDKNTDYDIYIAAHPNKNILAIRSNNTNLAIYDTVTNNKIWEKSSEHWCDGPVFGSIDDTVFIGNNSFNIESFNYKNNFCKSYLLQSEHCVMSKSFHPTEQEFSSFYNNKITTLTLDKKAFIEQSFSIKSPFVACKYSPDGSFIVGYAAFKECFILNPESGSRKQLTTDDTSSHAIALNPISFIVATLFCEDNCIHYWNAKNRTLITVQPALSPHDRYTYCSGSQDPFQKMSFSCDGTKIIVALTDKCIVLEVPFEALYKDITKEKATLIYWLLKQYQHNQNNELPDDVIQLFIHNILATSKYSLTNY